MIVLRNTYLARSKLLLPILLRPLQFCLLILLRTLCFLARSDMRYLPRSAFLSLQVRFIASILLFTVTVSCSGGGGEGGTPSPQSSGGSNNATPNITPLAVLPGVTRLQAYQNQLFWFDEDPFTHFKSWTTAGGPVNTLAMRMGRPFKIALSGQDVFWTEGPPNGVIPSGMQIKKIAPDGSVTLLSAEQPSCAPGSTDDLLVDGSSVYYVTASACSAAIVSSIVRLPLNNDPSVPLVTTSRAVWSMSADTNNLYWLEKRDDFAGIYDVKRVAKSGGSPQTLYSDAIQNNLAPSISVANGHVFFSETINSLGAYRIRQVPIAGGGSTILFEQSQGGPVQSLASDNTNVYWADNTSIQTMPGTGLDLYVSERPSQRP